MRSAVSDGVGLSVASLSSASFSRLHRIVRLLLVRPALRPVRDASFHRERQVRELGDQLRVSGFAAARVVAGQLVLRVGVGGRAAVRVGRAGRAGTWCGAPRRRRRGVGHGPRSAAAPACTGPPAVRWNELGGRHSRRVAAPHAGCRSVRVASGFKVRSLAFSFSIGFDLLFGVLDYTLTPAQRGLDCDRASSARPVGHRLVERLTPGTRQALPDSEQRDPVGDSSSGRHPLRLPLRVARELSSVEPSNFCRASCIAATACGNWFCSRSRVASADARQRGDFRGLGAAGPLCERTRGRLVAPALVALQNHDLRAFERGRWSASAATAGELVREKPLVGNLGPCSKMRRCGSLPSPRAGCRDRFWQKPSLE